MAENKKISELTQTTSITGEELVPIVIDGQNKVVKTQYLRGATNLGEDFVDIIGDDGNKYRVRVVNGEAISQPIEVFEAEPVVEGDNARFRGLIINQMYGGGTEVGDTPVSHSFIELYNLREEDLNLKGIYLWYRAKAGSWQSLALEGIIPARHSFLIRCGQHNAFFKQSVRCNILDYDMSWDIKLSDKGFSCYLCIGEETPEDNPQRETKDAEGNVNWTNGRYIDLLGCGGKTSNDTVWAYETRFLYCMDKNTAVHRVDFSNACAAEMTLAGLGSNAKNKGFNDIDCEPINYKTCNVDFYRPRCTKDGRWTEFYDKPKQKDTVPSMINIMFGENGDSARTFTFQTPLVDNGGFVKIRKQGELKWDTYETTIEVADNIEADTAVHRCIVHDLAVGNYEYMVGIEGCTSDTYYFDVKEFNESNPMRIIWTTDQQAWTKKEYDVWAMAARFLNQKAEQFDWHLNTGDISQNANRSNCSLC